MTPAPAPREVHLVELTVLHAVRYSATLGYLQAAAAADPELAARCRFQRHVHRQQSDQFDAVCEQVLASMHDPLALALTVYFWNRPQSLELARRVKRRWPHCWVVVGGNDVTHQQDALFTEAPWVDVLVHGEGELRFRQLLHVLLDLEVEGPAGDATGGAHALQRIDGISYRAEGETVTTAPPSRIADLAELPSPILSDVYSDSDITNSSMVVYETNRGCPYSCAFCYWGGATNSKVRQFPMERIEAELERLVRLMRPGAVLFIADANFGILGRDLEIARHIVALARRYRTWIQVTTNWAKNSSDRIVEIARLLHENDLTGAITLSAQSFDQDVLALANRSNIRLAHYQRLQERFRELGIPTYTDLIWGLPGESLESYRAGIEAALQAGGSPIVYPLLLLNNTDYTHERFRSEHGLTVRRMPCDVGNTEMVADVVVAHSRMSGEDWLHGMELRLPLMLFQKALLRCSLRVLHATSGWRLIDLCELLWDFLRGGASDPMVVALAGNFSDSWRDPAAFNESLVLLALGQVTIREELHYQAILRRVAATPERLRAVVAEVHDFLCARLLAAGAAAPDRDLLDAVATLDLAGAAMFQACISGRVEERAFSLPAATLRLLREAGDVPPGLGVDADPGGEGAWVSGRLRTPARWARYPLGVYALSVWHGTGRPLHEGEIVLTPEPAAGAA